MLSKFEVENFKNFKERIIFDFSDTRSYGFRTECVKDGIVSKGLIYGQNGSGKSNLGFAVFDLVSHLTDKNKAPYQYSQFLYAGGEEDRLAEFSYEFKFGCSELKYSYGKKDYESLVYEKLTINDEEKLFIDRREGSVSKITLEGTENLEKDLSGSNISLVSYVSKNTVLTNDDEKKIFTEFTDFVNRMLFFRSLEKNNYIGLEQGSRSIGAYIIKSGLLDDFESFLNDAGISCELSTIATEEDEVSLAFKFGSKKVSFYQIASQGTKSLSLFYYWLQRIKQPGLVSFVFIDEFDAFYHHSLAKLIVERLREVDSQVIITTHNTSIMSNDVLRPDCYFILDDGKIHSLADLTRKELRQSHNIEKMYKAGSFNG